MQKAVFLDRDGVINEVIFRNGNNQKPIAPWNIDEFRMIPGIKSSLCNLKSLGFNLFVFTNQPDIAKGIIDNNFVEKINNKILKELPVDEIRVCPHVDSDICNCRKPKPGMILSLSKRWNIDRSQSFVIGDNWKDIEAGKAAGCKTILLHRFYNYEANSDYRVNDLNKAAELICTTYKAPRKK